MEWSFFFGWFTGFSWDSQVAVAVEQSLARAPAVGWPASDGVERPRLEEGLRVDEGQRAVAGDSRVPVAGPLPLCHRDRRLLLPQQAGAFEGVRGLPLGREVDAEIR